MYSPFQEVPSTPALLSHARVLNQSAGTPEAVVPEVLVDQSQGQSVSVPGTPISSVVQSSPWTPNARSLIRTQKRRRYTYNPSLAPRFIAKSPAEVASPREQVVPSTPVGGFLFPKTPDTNRRKAGKLQYLSYMCQDTGDTIDGAGDRPRKRNRNENKENNNKIPTTRLRPRSQREIVARYRRSPEATPCDGDVLISHDFLDLI